MKKHIIHFLVLTAALVWAAGCVSSGDYQVQNQRLNALERDINDLKEQTQLKDLEMERQVSQTRTNLPELRLELDRIRSDIQRLNDSIESAEQGSGNEKIPIREQFNYIQARLDRLEAKLRLPPLSRNVISPSRGYTDVEPPATGPTEPTSQASGDQAEFDAAKALFGNKNYAAALPRFRSILEKYPNSSYAASSQFYLGECLFEQKKYEEAILEYQKVVQVYPKSNRVPIALLKQAYSFLNIGDKTSGTYLLKKVIREHPQSYAAGVAKQKLPTIQ